MVKILIIEPFYGGSHKALIDAITTELNSQGIDYNLITMKAKKWPWRARCSSLYISNQLPDLNGYTTLFCSCVLNLTELIGLCPNLAKLHKIVYFHENQLAYPIQKVKERDFQYGYNQITTCLTADVVLFNSKYNQDSFLNNLKKFFKIMPDYRPQNLNESIARKCHVLYFPVNFLLIDHILEEKKTTDKLNNNYVHIVWPHRWEFDKNPELLFDALYVLKDEGIKFKLSVLGEQFDRVPPIFAEAKEKLADCIAHFGYIETKNEFYNILCDANIVVSTADHEFFGVSIVESVRAGCVPLLPNKLVYPELYPSECLYQDKEHLINILRMWCLHPHILNNIKKEHKIDTNRFDSKILIHNFIQLLK